MITAHLQTAVVLRGEKDLPTGSWNEEDDFLQSDYALARKIYAACGQRGLQTAQGFRLVHDSQDKTSRWMSKLRQKDIVRRKLVV
jgi:hypothetical protein